MLVCLRKRWIALIEKPPNEYIRTVISEKTVKLSIRLNPAPTREFDDLLRPGLNGIGGRPRFSTSVGISLNPFKIMTWLCGATSGARLSLFPSTVIFSRGMYFADDPTLALIARFVGISPLSDGSELEFLRQQIATIEDYVARSPAADRERLAMAWIEANAQRYRQQWQKRVAIDRLADARCPDCPLQNRGDGRQCIIHDRWLDLLQRYAADEISSPEYVEQSLALLRSHKNELHLNGEWVSGEFLARAGLRAH